MRVKVANYLKFTASATAFGWSATAFWTNAGLFSPEAGSGALAGLAASQALAALVSLNGIKSDAGIKYASPWNQVGTQFDSVMNTRPSNVFKSIRIHGRSMLNFEMPQLQFQDRAQQGISYSAESNTYFLEDKPTKKKASELFDEVYFGRVYPQVPGSALWMFLRFAEQNRLRGVGLSERYWVGRCQRSWWSPRWYKPIGMLLSRAEARTGVQLVMQHANQWKELLHNATFTWNAVVATEFPDQFEKAHDTFQAWAEGYQRAHQPPGVV